MSGVIHLERPAEHIVLIELDNPPHNSLGRKMREQFERHLDAIEADLDVRAVVIAGRGRAFSSGDDLKERLEGVTKAGGERETERDLASFDRLFRRVETLRPPTIAAIHGWCIGGGLELALSCDIRIASTEAKFVCAGVNVGLMSSAYRLPRLIGIARAKEMLLTGQIYSVEEAEHSGLVTAIHSVEELMEAAIKLAERIASRAPLSVEATKRVAGRALDLTSEEASELQARELGQLLRSSDHAAAINAFNEKREPLFTRS